MLYTGLTGTAANPRVIDLSGQSLGQLLIQNCHNVRFTADPADRFRIDVSRDKGIVVSGSTNIVIEYGDVRGPDGDNYLTWDAAKWQSAPVRGIAGSGCNGITIQHMSLKGLQGGIQINGDGTTIQNNLIRGLSSDLMRGYGNDLKVLKNDVGDLFKVGANHVDHWQGSEKRGLGPFYNVTIAGNIMRSAVTNAGHPLAHAGGQCIFQKAQGTGIVFYNVLVENNILDTFGAKAIAFRGVDGGIIRDNIILSTEPGGAWPRIAVGNSDNVAVYRNIAQEVVERGAVNALSLGENYKLIPGNAAQLAVVTNGFSSGRSAAQIVQDMKAYLTLTPNVNALLPSTPGFDPDDDDVPDPVADVDPVDPGDFETEDPTAPEYPDLSAELAAANATIATLTADIAGRDQQIAALAATVSDQGGKMATAKANISGAIQKLVKAQNAVN